MVTSVTLIRSRSSYTHTFTDTRMHVCLLAFLSLPDSWLPGILTGLLCFTGGFLPNSLFLLDTGSFLWTTTSCRPCQTAFLPGFQICSECACFFSWLSTAILRFRESVDVLSWLTCSCLRFWCCWCVCVCFVSRCAPADKQTQ